MMQLVYFAAAVVVLAEALNKLERADLFGGQRGWMPRLYGCAFLLAPWRWKRNQVVHVFKVLGWACLSVGAAGAIAAPLLHSRPATLPDVAVIGGFALLIVRSRLKEG